jgi:glucose-1-phosphate cytidylyltransferase
MQVVILAGGLGTRLSEETTLKPKPMVEIGGYPILWHIMKIYDTYGFTEFFIALGYKGEVVKRYFLDYYPLNSNMSITLADGQVEIHSQARENWKVHLIDTGLLSNTGGRLKKLEPWLNKTTFMLTYGDGVADVDISRLIQFHQSRQRLATVTAVRPPARFGGLRFEGDIVAEFIEKPQIGEGWINGGFMVMEPGVFDYLEDDSTSLEAHTLEWLARDEQLAAYRHDQFWQCMDTLRDVRMLEDLWKTGTPPWKTWE